MYPQVDKIYMVEAYILEGIKFFLQPHCPLYSTYADGVWSPLHSIPVEIKTGNQGLQTVIARKGRIRQRQRELDWGSVQSAQLRLCVGHMQTCCGSKAISLCPREPYTRAFADETQFINMRLRRVQGNKL